MSTSEIIREIEQLPLQKRIFIVERTIHTMREKEDLKDMEIAAQKLTDEYRNNRELTELTNLDFETFYEAR
ncbi:MAG: hypothetical protein HY960_01780 [Ignavibacteriae bacterium]|nr:hypothetical protein [Ignavibacteriota bacterium]